MDAGPVNIAMIGCGGYAAYLIDWLATIPEVCRLTAATSRNPDTIKAVSCRSLGIPVYKNTDELFTHISPEDCPVVVIPTSIDSHLRYTAEAISRGFHVLLEKPPVATIQDVDRLIRLQQESGRWIAVNFQHLYNSTAQSLKSKLMAGDFGQVLSVRAQGLWRRPKSYFSRSFWSGRLQVDGRWVLDGTLGNPLAHLMAEALYLSTSEPGMGVPIQLEAELYRANRIESEDTSIVRLQVSSGASVFYCASLASGTIKPTVCEIETTKGCIRLTDYKYAEITYNSGEKQIVEYSDTVIGGEQIGMFKSSLQSLAANQRPLVTVEDCRPYMLAWNGAFESAGVPAEIPESLIEEIQCNDDISRVVRNMQVLGDAAFKQQKFFSELSEEWRSGRKTVLLDSYTSFPSLSSDLMAIENACKEPVCC